MTEKIKEYRNKIYPRTFWVANGVELLERAAFYAMFISISLYLSRVVGYNDIWASIIGGFFSAGVYLLPMFVGALSDKMGFRQSIIIAFLFQSIAYFTLAALPYKLTVFPAYILLMVGGSFIKSLITGTVAKSTTETNRARAFSIFYFIVNIGSFTGKTFAYPVRIELGLEAVNFVSAGLTFLALIAVYLFYKNVDLTHEGKTLKETWNALLKVFLKPRLVFLILIIAGFWLIQHQMYASMPKYILRMVGEHAAPEWIANINPAVVMVFVVIVTNFMRKRRAITSLKVGLFIIPFSAFFMALGPYLETITGSSISFVLFNMHPITLMMIIGIAFQGIAECFISPRYLEYFSLQAPKGEEGLYLGFSHLHSFFANLIGFFISGFLLDAFCPDPQRADLINLTPELLAPYYANAEYIWYVFAGIGFLSALSLIVYERVVNYIDRKKGITI
ncbi:MAG: MFS transporter [bacterium]